MSLPEGWREVNLFDICKPKQWKTISIKNLEDKGYVVYGANGKIGYYSTYTHEKPTVMITCRGATCGNIHISEPFSYINGNAMALDALSDDVELKFLYYFLLSTDFSDVISGSAQPQITREGLKVIKISLSSIEEQKQIVQKLDQALACVERIKMALDNTPATIKRFRQSVLALAVSGGLSEGKDWEKLILNDVILEKPRNGYSPKGVNYETKIKNLTLTATTSGKFKGEYFKYLDIEIDDNSYLWLEKGDILVQRANTLEYVGMSAIYDGEKNTYIYPDLMMKIKSNPNKIENKYLHYILLSHGTRQYFRSNATGTSGNMPKINQKVLMATPLLLPPLKEQKAIVKKVETLFALAENLEEKVNQAQKRVDRLIQSILAKAFRGEL